MTTDSDPKTATLKEVATDARGNTIYREPNGAGGNRYWSDAIGGGVVLWDTCLASIEELELVIRLEREREGGMSDPRIIELAGITIHVRSDMEAHHAECISRRLVRATVALNRIAGLEGAGPLAREIAEEALLDQT